MVALLTNTRSPTRPRSMRRSTAAPKASRAPATSSRSRPRSMARWLRVPAGTHTNPTPLAAATPATRGWEPSPPPPPPPPPGAPPGPAPPPQPAQVAAGSQHHRLDPAPSRLGDQVEALDL